MSVLWVALVIGASTGGAGRVGRPEGAALLLAYAAYVLAHAVLR